MLSDVFPTAFHATELARVTPGNTVAVFGAGPVGLLSAYCSLLKGAAEVYVVDRIRERLQKAEELGATAIDFSKGDPVEQIFKLRQKNKGIQQSLRPVEEKMKGLDCAIDAVGYQARSDKDPDKELPTQVLENCLRVVNPTGSIGMIGVYIAPDPGAQNEAAKSGIFPFPIADFFDKALTDGKWASPSQEIQRISARPDREWQGEAQQNRNPSHSYRPSARCL